MSFSFPGEDLKTFPLELPEDEWRRRLTPQQYAIMRAHGTEKPCTSPLNAEKRAGTYACAGCGHTLFDTKAKFESGTGWPSFSATVTPDAVETQTDVGFGMTRTEVHCANCGSHLGHVFPDGPPPTGQRYCMNGVALTFQPA